MKRVTIVDDSLEFGRMVRDTLQSIYTDLTITLVPSAEEALLEAARVSVDLLISDVRLPGISGLDLVPKIRARHPEIGTILVTGLTDEKVKRQAEKLGVTAFFRKPMDMGTFLSVVEQVLGGEPPLAAAESPAAQAEPALVTLAPPAEPGLSQQVAELRQTLGAEAVALLDDFGRVAAHSGSPLPEDFEKETAALVMSALSAAGRLGRWMEAAQPTPVQVLRGASRDLVAGAIGTYALVLVLPAGRSALRLALALEEVLAAQKDLAEALTRMGIHWQQQPEMSLPAEGSEAQAAEQPDLNLDALPLNLEEVGDLLDLLEKPAEVVAPAGDLDSFWESAAQGGDAAPLPPDVLSYDQARQLGLAPDEPPEQP